ncbi:MAG: sulfatase-like hydrolase/transferase, partial [Balneolaceae bacterium]|nr:sulfatase-like hydrolase/transferase [Balneolaceae bacterium]
MVGKNIATTVVAIFVVVPVLHSVRGQSPDQSRNGSIHDNYNGGKPNIVFIMADDLGYADVNTFSPLGDADYYETPNIDRLAKQGMKFVNAYTNGTNCTPTRAALISGQYYPRQPIYTNITGNRGEAEHRKVVAPPTARRLPAEIYTLPEALADAGYATGRFGKWHLRPNREGERVFSEARVSTIEMNGVRLGQGTKLGPTGKYIADELNRRALQFIEEYRHQPFFLYLS